MTTYGSLFTGGGLADWGARAAGLTPVWGVEYDAQIAAVAAQNDRTGTIHCASVVDVDYTALPRADVLHASPPCPNFSVAKTGGVETAIDLALADAVCRAIRAQAPTLFTLENVRGYAQSQSLARIQACLLDLDYHVTTVVINAADYGVPQTRERLFLFAHAGGWMQSQRPLPSKQPWRGWYQAIEDLIPTLPASAFAPWQLDRLRAAHAKGMDLSGDLFIGGANKSASFLEFAIENRPTIPGIRTADDPMLLVPADSSTCMAGRAFLMSATEQRRDTTCFDDEPAFVIKAQDRMPRAFLVSNSSDSDMRACDGSSHATTATEYKNMRRAFLVSDQSESAGSGIQIRDEEEPSTTIRSGNSGGAQPRAWLSQGRVVAMTPRALARFQTLPDAYVLPDKKSLACRIIGNGVAVDAYAVLLRSQL